MKPRSTASTSRRGGGPSRGLAAAGFWTFSFLSVYALGLGALALTPLPGPLVPIASGALSAGVFSLLANRRRASAGPSRAHLVAVDRVSREMDGITDRDALASLVVTALNKALRPTQVYLWLPDRENGDYHLAAGFGPDPECGALCEHWVKDFYQFLTSDDAEPSDLPPGGSEFSAWLAHRELTLCLPILSKGRMIGLLTSGDKANGKPYTPGDRWLLNQTLRQTALALSYLGLQKEEKKRRSKLDKMVHLYADAQRRAVTDGLTGLATHLYFKEQLSQRFHEARRHATELSMMLLDIDHFKQFNDTYGHPMGDEVLRRVAASVKQSARVCDTVARYGGEELALVLPQTDLVGAAALAERIREAVEALELHDGKGRRLPPITVSVGVAQFEEADGTFEQLIERADTALYQAKHLGRNQVCQAS